MATAPALPTLNWDHAPQWATIHFYQSWGAGFWSDCVPALGQHAYNRGRWGLLLTAKSKASGHELPLGIDYRLSVEWRPRVDPIQGFPSVICLCGSTRFSEAYQQANLRETLAGKIVLTIGCDMRSDRELFEGKTQEELIDLKQRLDELHLRKIDLADEVLVLNVGQYIGESTARELAYAHDLGKIIRFWEEIPEGVTT